jgi:hypothetical protein
MTLSKPSGLVEATLVPHSAFERALTQLEMAFKYASNQSEAQGIAIVGESGTGKTSVLDYYHAQHPSRREADGMLVPILRVTVPSTPTVKSLAAVMLDGLQAPDSDRGTENERTKQLRELMTRTGVLMVMLDEFQHFYDKKTRRFIYNVADWLKVLIDQVRCTLVVAGLPNCMEVIEGNEQLQRRFLAPVQMPRFDWDQTEQRHEFTAILGAFHEQLSTRFRVPALDSKEMSFRFYCATGGLMSLISKILRHAERKASCTSSKAITLDILDEAHIESVWMSGKSSEVLRPFHRSFDADASAAALKQAKSIQLPADQQSPHTETKSRISSRTIHSVFSKKKKQ